MTNLKRYIVAIGLILIVISGCTYDESKKGAFMKNYVNVLAATDPQKIETIRHGSEEESKAIEKFNEFYKVFSTDVIRKSIKDVYAENAYFRDGFREVQGVDNLEKYFISSTETFHECTFDIQDVASHGGNYYYRWIMNLILKRNKDDKLQAVGAQLSNFIDTITGKAQPIITTTDAIESVRVVQRAYQAAVENRWEKVAP